MMIIHIALNYIWYIWVAETVTHGLCVGVITDTLVITELSVAANVVVKVYVRERVWE